MRLIIITIIVSTIFANTLVADPIVGEEYFCGNETIYFGNTKVWYSAPGYGEDFQKNKSIISSTADESHAFSVKYNAGWKPVRKIGCESASAFCEQEFMRSEKEGEQITVSFLSKIEFYKSGLSLSNVSGIHSGFFLTIRDNQLQLENGYKAELLIEMQYSNFLSTRSYEFSDNRGLKLVNNLWDHLKQKKHFKFNCEG